MAPPDGFRPARCKGFLASRIVSQIPLRTGKSCAIFQYHQTGPLLPGNTRTA